MSMNRGIPFLGLVLSARRVTAALAMLGGLALVGVAAAPAWGFVAIKTADGHENITRAALSCSANGAPTGCFQGGRFHSTSMSQLAGGRLKNGAVEAPDAGIDPREPRPGYGFQFAEANHCMNGDYNIVGARSYRQSMAAARANLLLCVRGVTSRMATAVQLAANLLPITSKRSAIPSTGCTFFKGEGSRFAILDGIPVTPSQAGGPKCAVINELGRGMHTAQDFYAHSNWTDAKLPGQNSVANPPGLGRTDVPDFLRFTCSGGGTVSCSPLTETFPAGLVTACNEGGKVPIFGRYPGAPGCNDSTAMTGAIAEASGGITHGTLNKDNGTINPRTGAATKPGNPRGKIKDVNGVTNYQRAITGAINQTRATWSDFIAALQRVYGPAKSQLMVRVLTCDKPWQPKTCPPSGAPATGGGSTAGVADPALFGAGGAAVVAGAGMLVFTRRRGGASRG